jgi:hypothetical protein
VSTSAPDAFKCDICGNTFKSDNGLKIHQGKAHKSTQPKESLRQSEESPPCLSASPLLNISREDVVREEEPMFGCDWCEDLFYTGEDMDTHTIEIHKHNCIINGLYSSIPCPGCLVP